MFYEDREELCIMWLGQKFILELIIICHDYESIIQEKWSKHDNIFENTKFNVLLRLITPEILINILECHVMDFLNLQCWQLYLHAVMS